MDVEKSSPAITFTKDNVSDSYRHETIRLLNSRYISLIAFASAIGTTVFITIGSGLLEGGPLGLLLAYAFWTFIIFLLTTAAGEMTCYLPIHASYISFLGRTIDESLEVAAGYNFYIMYSLFVPFEITAVNNMIHYWRDDYSPAIVIVLVTLLYVAINIFAVKYYGESEFWLAIFKLILAVGLLFFTLVTMCGGNPHHDAFGFRNWNVEGGPIAQYLSTGASGRFQGIINAMINASFTVIGPELLSAIAGEAKNPRGTKEYPGTMVVAFKTVVYRLIIFYVLGALSVGILVAYNDPTFVAANSASSNSKSSPYVIAMLNMGITGLPDLVTAIIVTASLSAGSSFFYVSSRLLYTLACDRKAPGFFRKCTKSGVPIYCVGMSAVFACLSFMEMGTTASTALNYMVGLCNGSQVLNYMFMAISYIGFYRACKAQNIDRNEFVYKSWYQPYSIYFTLFFLVIMVAILGYTVYLPGMWSVDTFLFSYIMVFVSIFIAIVWKVLKRTEFKFFRPEQADLTSGLEEIEQHEYEFFSQLENKQHTDHVKYPWYKKILNWFL